MISRIDLRGRGPGSLSRTALASVLPRAATDVEAALAQIRPVCDDVRRRGAPAVREYTARFDGVDLAATPVPRDGYAIGVAEPGTYKKIFDSDDARFGGSAYNRQSEVHVVQEGAQGYSLSLRLNLPPLAAMFFIGP